MLHLDDGGKPVETVPSAEDEYLASLDPDPLEGLTERQRFVLELRYGLRDGVCYSQREVAALMGISQSVVWKHEHLAKKKLDKWISNRDISGPNGVAGSVR